MLRRLVFPLVVALSLAGCDSTATNNGASSTSATVPQPTSTEVQPEAAAQGEPKTLEAATAAEQENADRYSSGDYAGQWLLYSSQLRDAISQDDYAAYGARCEKETGRPPGLGFTVEGVRMEGDSKAFVRIGLLGVKLSRTMVYEDGAWLQEPTDVLVENFGKPVEQWVC